MSKLYSYEKQAIRNCSLRYRASTFARVLNVGVLYSASSSVVDCRALFRILTTSQRSIYFCITRPIHPCTGDNLFYTSVVCLICTCSARTTICWFAICSFCSCFLAAFFSSSVPVCILSCKQFGMTSGDVRRRHSGHAQASGQPIVAAYWPPSVLMAHHSLSVATSRFQHIRGGAQSLQGSHR